MRTWLPLIAISLGSFMLMVDLTIVTVALPRIAIDLSSSLTSLPWGVDAYALALAVLLIGIGGPRRRAWPSTRLPGRTGAVRHRIDRLWPRAHDRGARRRPRRRGRRRCDVVGIAVFTIASAAATFALIRASVDGWTSPLVLGLLVLTLLGAGAFVMIEARVDQPLIDPLCSVDPASQEPSSPRWP